MNESIQSASRQETNSFSNLNEANQNNTEVITQETINLLEERLIVENKRYKIGEVVVRKVVEILTIEVPVRYEKLIVEQVYPEYKQLAEIDLDEEEHRKISNAKSETYLNGKSTIKSEFDSIYSAMQYLEMIALQEKYEKVQIEMKIKL